jgi:hypothetical protein
MSNIGLFRKILNTKVAKMELLFTKQILIFYVYKPYKASKKIEAKMNLNDLYGSNFINCLKINFYEKFSQNLCGCIADCFGLLAY